MPGCRRGRPLPRRPVKPRWDSPQKGRDHDDELEKAAACRGGDARPVRCRWSAGPAARLDRGRAGAARRRLAAHRGRQCVRVPAGGVRDRAAGTAGPARQMGRGHALQGLRPARRQPGRRRPRPAGGAGAALHAAAAQPAGALGAQVGRHSLGGAGARQARPGAGAAQRGRVRRAGQALGGPGPPAGAGRSGHEPRAQGPRRLLVCAHARGGEGRAGRAGPQRVVRQRDDAVDAKRAGRPCVDRRGAARARRRPQPLRLLGLPVARGLRHRRPRRERPGDAGAAGSRCEAGAERPSLRSLARRAAQRGDPHAAGRCGDEAARCRRLARWCTGRGGHAPGGRRDGARPGPDATAARPRREPAAARRPRERPPEPAPHHRRHGGGEG